jgi:hypothetical protein
MAVRAADIEWKRDDDSFVSSSPVPIPLIGRSLPIRVERERREPTPAQLEAVHGLLRLPAERLEEFTHAVALDCWYACLEFEIADQVPPVRLRKRTQVWRHVTWQEVHIPTHRRSRDRYAFLYAECAWDVEHGLELLLQNGRLLRVGRQEGLSSSEEWDLYFINE